MTKPIVLIADNLESDLDSVREFLEPRGFEVLTAGTVEKTKEILHNQRVHLAVVDLRLRDDADNLDESGLTEVIEQGDPTIPKILWTTHPTWERVAKALGRRPDGGQLAFDFVAKRDGLDKLLSKIQEGLRTTGINFGLEIGFQAGLSFGRLAADLLPAGDEPQLLLQMAAELRDLYRKLFTHQRLITIYPIPAGRSGAILTLVQPVNEQGLQRMVVVKCGPREMVAAEKRNYEQYVRGYAAARSTSVEAFAMTRSLAGLVLTLVGTEPDEAYETFEDFYKATAEVSPIGETLEDLCRMMSLWRRQARQPLELPLSAWYRQVLGLDPRQEAIQERVRELAASDLPRADLTLNRERRTLLFRLNLNGLVELPDPVQAAFHRPELFQTPPHIPLSLTTHGDLNARNILVGPRHQAWLLDFSHTGPGFVLRDFVELESIITLELVRERDLGLLYHYTRNLLAPAHLDDPIPAGDNLPADLGKAAKVVNLWRRLALRWVQEPDGSFNGFDIRYYYMGLFFHAIRLLALRGGSPIGQHRSLTARRSHALLTAALIIDRLSKWPSW